jgi:hypothetical protein
MVKHFKQIAMRVEPQADITITGVCVLNRAVIAGICERLADIGFAHTVPEGRLFELNFNIHVSNIIDMKTECNSPSEYPRIKKAVPTFTFSLLLVLLFPSSSLRIKKGCPAIRRNSLFTSSLLLVLPFT